MKDVRELQYRRLETMEEYCACVELQRETWGADFADAVPPSLLKTSQRIGGVTAGAFDSENSLLGFVFGMTGVEDGQLVHWSDMLAVRLEARELGVGYKLKCLQRELLLPLGVERVYWTFDPLESKNAYFNLNKLGAGISEYVENMYGETSSTLHHGLGTDRFVIDWRITSDKVKDTLAGEFRRDSDAFAAAPILNTEVDDHNRPVPTPSAPPEAKRIRVEVPENIQEEKLKADDIGAKWRASTREAFMLCLDAGYTVSHLERDAAKRCFYCLERE